MRKCVVVRKRPRRRWKLALWASAVVLGVVLLAVFIFTSPLKSYGVEIKSTALMPVSITLLSLCDAFAGAVISYSDGSMAQIKMPNFENLTKAMPELHLIPRAHRYFMVLPPPAAGCQIPRST